ncbi:YhcN/YlaJ family sporulation lipoprotein [Thalassobacillus hwangdonensis]|uniref:YhcN/YlaJ family sporulation lipoprotein n=1 Tax=Thalassobacillus hwangdonensis TaxID=546108 RepID=A0ABW3L073_9BACI
MYRWIGLLMVVSLFILGGCGQDDQAQEKQQNDTENLYQPMKSGEQNDEVETPDPDYGNRPYHKRDETREIRNTQYGESNRSHDNGFYNEESLRITEAVNEIKEVTMTQAIATEDRIMVAVMINPYDQRDHSVAQKVRHKVEKMANGKKVYVYTNNNRWDHMKDLNARLKAEQAPGKVKEQINEFIDRFGGE